MSDFKDKCGDVLTGGATGAAVAVPEIKSNSEQ